MQLSFKGAHGDTGAREFDRDMVEPISKEP